LQFLSTKVLLLKLKLKFCFFTLITFKKLLILELQQSKYLNKTIKFRSLDIFQCLCYKIVPDEIFNSQDRKIYISHFCSADIVLMFTIKIYDKHLYYEITLNSSIFKVCNLKII